MCKKCTNAIIHTTIINKEIWNKKKLCVLLKIKKSYSLKDHQLNTVFVELRTFLFMWSFYKYS